MAEKKKIINPTTLPMITMSKGLKAFLNLKEDDEYLDYNFVSAEGGIRFIAFWNEKECSISKELISHIEESIKEFNNQTIDPKQTLLENSNPNETQ